MPASISRPRRRTIGRRPDARGLAQPWCAHSAVFDGMAPSADRDSRRTSSKSDHARRRDDGRRVGRTAVSSSSMSEVDASTSLGGASLSVVVPTYRSPGTLSQLVDEVLAHLSPRFSSVDFVFVDDGSPDDTWSSIVALSEKYNCVRGIRLSRNYGQHNALLAGIRSSTSDLILTMDDDLQNPPDQIELLIAALTPDVDLAYGYPVSEAQSRLRNFASRATKRLMRAGLGDAVNPRHSAFRLFRRRLVRRPTGYTIRSCRSTSSCHGRRCARLPYRSASTFVPPAHPATRSAGWCATR